MKSCSFSESSDPLAKLSVSSGHLVDLGLQLLHLLCHLILSHPAVHPFVRRPHSIQQVVGAALHIPAQGSHVASELVAERAELLGALSRGADGGGAGRYGASLGHLEEQARVAAPAPGPSLARALPSAPGQTNLAPGMATRIVGCHCDGHPPWGQIWRIEPKSTFPLVLLTF